MTNNHIPPQYWSRTIFYLFLSDYFYIIHRAVKGVWCLKSKSRGLGDSMVILMSQSRGLGDSMVILMSQSMDGRQYGDSEEFTITKMTKFVLLIKYLII